MFYDIGRFMRIVHIVQYYSAPIILKEWREAMGLDNSTDNNTKIFNDEAPIYALIPGLDIISHVQPSPTPIMNYIEITNKSVMHFAGKYYKEGEKYGVTRLVDCSSPYLLLYYGKIVPDNIYDIISINVRNFTQNFSEDVMKLCNKFQCLSSEYRNGTYIYQLKRTETMNNQLMLLIRLMNLNIAQRRYNYSELEEAY